MEKQIKKTFWLLGVSVVYFIIIISVSNFFVHNLKNEEFFVKWTISYFILILLLIFFLASFISNIIKFRKDKKSKKHLFILIFTTLLIFLMFFGFILIPDEKERAKNKCMKNGYPDNCKKMIIWGCGGGYSLDDYHCHSFEEAYGDCEEDDYRDCGIIHLH